MVDVNYPKGGRAMPRSEALNRAIKKYEAEKVERIIFRVPKGKKALIQEYAAQRGESLNAFLNRVVNEEMEKESREEWVRDLKQVSDSFF